MAGGYDNLRWQTDGKFFRAGTHRVWMKAVTYGPFPSGWPESFERDFAQIVTSGFNAIRVYEIPDVRLLDAALAHGLKVFGGLKWGQNLDFMMKPRYHSAAMVRLVSELKIAAGHPALAGVYVGNEIPADLARWMGPIKVRLAIEALISLGKAAAPQLLFAYANYPSTEYLEPENADFTAFNVYLEDESALRSYLKRLHHIAGDRPLVISEFGLDSQRNGLEKQAETLRWCLQATHELETAGTTIYAWSDRWWNGGAEVLDWDFGLLDREGNAKPALSAITAPNQPSSDFTPHVSVIVCTRNGMRRIGACLRAIGKLVGGNIETIVVDDGSEDGTAEYVAQNFPWAYLIKLDHSGLSTARNAGAVAAQGELLAFTDDDCEPDAEWISRIRPAFQDARYAAACGPNLPPRARTWEAAVVCAAPGAPSHVMLDDDEAEHLPGCNLVVRKSAFTAIDGFDPQFRTAGDDVDFCWRLRDAGYRLAFVAGAFVWHWRRPSVFTFLRQQVGYGHAERLLMAKHPSRFSNSGDAKWQGFIYGGGPVRVMNGSIIYHGSMGNAGYQGILNRMLPLRGLDEKFRIPRAKIALAVIHFLQPQLRSWARNRRFRLHRRAAQNRRIDPTDEFQIHCTEGLGREHYLGLLIGAGWQPAGESDAWDVAKDGTRVLLAIEYGESRSQTLLVRVWGDPVNLQFLKLLHSNI